MKNLLLGLAACSLTIGALAQEPFRCATDELRLELIANDPGYLQREAEYAEEIRQLIAENAQMRDGHMIVTIPVVFHVLHLGGRENISDEQIHSELEILNRDYRNMNPDLNSAIPHFQNISGDAMIQFSLPTIDPAGQCTNGINRIRTVQTFQGASSSKLQPWPRSKYLNIWVTDQIARDPNVLAYATLPGTAEGFLQLSDGIMSRHQAIGTMGTANPAWEGTITHEVGHFLGLLHTWGPGNSPVTGDCGDDGVQDTPWTKGHNSCADRLSYICSTTEFPGTLDFSWMPAGAGTTDPTPSPLGTTGNFEVEAILPFINVKTDSGPQDPTPQPGIFIPGIAGSAVEYFPFMAEGVSQNSMVEGEFAFSNWEMGGAINTGKFYEFTFIPQEDFGVNIDTVRFSVRRSLTGPRNFAVRTNADWNANRDLFVGAGNVSIATGNVATLEEGTTAWTHNLTAHLGNFHPSEPVTIRVYAWGATDETGFFAIDNFRMIGSAWHSGLEYAPVTASGVSSGSMVAQEFAFSGWGTGAPDGATDLSEMTGDLSGSQFYEFTIAPHIQYAMRAQQLVIRVRRSDEGPRSFAVRRGPNFTAGNLPLTLTPGSGIESAPGNAGFFTNDVAGDWATITVNLPGTTASQEPLVIRIYAWNAETAEGYFSVDDIRITGTFGIIENVENYMEYSFCSKMFTQGQVDRMRAVLSSVVGQRSSLVTLANLQATGTGEGNEVQCPPRADFYVVPGVPPSNFSNPVIPYTPHTCTGAQVQMRDNSSGGQATAWSWTFQDGEPATSTERHPMVSFTSPGWKSVTLTVSNANGSHTKNSPFEVWVNDASSAMAGLASYGFEDVPGTWPFGHENYERNFTQWQRHPTVGHNSNACIYLNAGQRDPFEAINPTNATDIDDLVSPNFNLTGVQNANFSFWYSYSTRTTVMDSVSERLLIQRSTDCGRTWTWITNQTQSTIQRQELVSNGNSITPGGWRFRSYDLPAAALTDNVIFRFRFISSEYSNNLYVDDINIGASVGIAEATGTTPMSVYPNPTNDHFFVEMAGMDMHSTEITLMDGRGAIVHQAIHAPQGDRGIMISSQSLGIADGLYVLRVSNELGTSTQKLMVGR